MFGSLKGWSLGTVEICQCKFKFKLQNVEKKNYGPLECIKRRNQSTSKERKKTWIKNPSLSSFRLKKNISKKYKPI